MITTRKNLLIGIWVFTLIVVCYAITTVSSQVNTMEHNLRTINNSIQNEKENLRTLDAEWSYLTDPSRIEKLSAELLPTLTIIKAEDIADLNTLKESNNVIAISNDIEEKNIIRVHMGDVE